MIPYFIPFERVGDFVFGTKIDEYLDRYSFDFLPKDDSMGYDSYSIDNPQISLFIENGTIDSISCSEEFLFKGRNIIGMNIEEFMAFADIFPQGDIDELEFEEDDIPQNVYEFEEIGLQVWAKKGIIVTIIASPKIEEE